MYYKHHLSIRNTALLALASKIHFTEKMEISRENFRAMIFYDFRVGLSQEECIDRLRKGFDDEAPSKTRVYEWSKEFKFGRCSLKDQPR